LRVVVTHMHPDHVGLADWICKRWQAPLFMSMTDYALARLWAQPHSPGSAAGGEAAVAHYARHGLDDPESQEKIRQRATYYSGLVPSVPSTFHRLMH
ncbi:MBL fold metallo-hydrolase, partial [Algoriphagus aestuarii]|nr:MBL fold metallo-hydrolase [Algoriphagus aestuarii]